MDVARLVITCRECGEPVRVSWHLYCDDCYRRLTGGSEDVSGADLKDLSGDRCGRPCVYDRSGQRYVLDGKAWRRDSGR